MKTLFYCSILSLALVACGGAPTTTEAAHGEEGHVHTYSCPMHPEVTGQEGDRCPKCGMMLEHTDLPEQTASYRMQVSTNPAQVVAGQAVQLTFRPQVAGQEQALVPLDIEHEKKIHLIMVSEDLAWFDHIHPDLQPDGNYTVTATFPAGGRYTLFSDYKPSGAGHQLEKTVIEVSGTPATPVTYSGARLTGSSGGYTLKITSTDPIITNNALHLAAELYKGSQRINVESLDNYLGAKAHVVVVGVAGKEYLHVHPDVSNGAFDLHTTFDNPGIYKGWLQFVADGKVQTIDFLFDVKEGQPGTIQGHEGHGDHSGQGGHQH